MTRLKIAVQKSGRLYDDSLALLRECGISINNGKDQLMAQASNFSLEILYLRNSDIPHYVEDGIVDLAIIGENTLIEKPPLGYEVIGFGILLLSCFHRYPEVGDFYGTFLLGRKANCHFLPEYVECFFEAKRLAGRDSCDFRIRGDRPEYRFGGCHMRYREFRQHLV